MFSFIKKAYQTLATAEKKFLFWAILVILFLSSVNWIFALIVENDNLYHTSVNTIAGSDKPVYISQIEQARQGHILFKNLYTSEPQVARFFAPVWLILGWLGKLTSLSNMAVFHLSRLILAAGFLLLLYLFITKFFSKIRHRQLAFLTLSLSAGFGIFTLKRYVSPDILYEFFSTDLWVAEGNTFLTLSHSALFILSQILILYIFWWTIERLAASHLGEVILVGLLALFLGIFHPYDLVIVESVLFMWFAGESLKNKKINWRSFLKLAIIGALAALAIGYFIWLIKTEPALGGWASQNYTLSPRFLNYLNSFGLLFFGVVLALYKLVKSSNPYYRFLAIWIIVGWYLLFIPLQFQRRLANGLHIPMAIAGFLGLMMIIAWLKEKLPKFYAKPVVRLFLWDMAIVLLTLTTLFNLFIGLVIYSRGLPPHFVSAEVYQAMRWAKDNVQPGQAILSSPVIGNILPSVTGNIVYIGHGHQTIDWQTKKIKVEDWFFAGNTQDPEKKAWLNRENIAYIFFSSLEDDFGDFSPQEKDYLKKVYANSEAAIFKVVSH